MSHPNAFSRDVCVVGGGGHVGLPLALTFADSGLLPHEEEPGAMSVAIESFLASAPSH